MPMTCKSVCFKLFFLVFISTINTSLFAQDKTTIKLANTFFDKENFEEALPEYLELLKSDEGNMIYNLS